MENAKKFMDFLVSKQAQDAFGTELTVRPVSKTAAVSSCMTHFHNINLIYENTEYVKSHKSEIISRFKGIHAAVLNIE
jgi:iron(III) transport system substrate-binding protein